MDLKLFTRIISAIKEHDQWQEKFSDFLEENICDDSYCIVNAGDGLVKVLLEILETEFNDVDEWIDWWLYENVDKIITYPDGIKRDITNIEDFYKFMLEVKEENKGKSKEPKGSVTLEEILGL